MTVILQEQFRNLVKNELSRLHWSRARLAHEMGVSPSYVSNYLNGDKDPGDDVKEKFFTALGVAPRLTIEPLPTSREQGEVLVGSLQMLIKQLKSR